MTGNSGSLNLYDRRSGREIEARYRDDKPKAVVTQVMGTGREMEGSISIKVTGNNSSLNLLNVKLGRESNGMLLWQERVVVLTYAI